MHGTARRSSAGHIHALLGGLFSRLVVAQLVAVVVAGSRMAGEAVHLLFRVGAHATMEFGNHRLLRIVHLFDVVAATAGREVAVDHLLMHFSSELRTHGELLFRRAHRALNFADEGDGASMRLIEEQGHIIDRADMFIGVVLQMAIRATGGSAGAGAIVKTLLIGDIRRIHRVAELAAEFDRASPVNDARQHADKHNADDHADEADHGEIPLAVLFHFVNLFPDGWLP